MNRNLLIVFALAIVLMSCGSKNEKKVEEVSTTKINKPVVDKIIGVGRIVPENEIIQFAVPVSGILKTIYKKENEIVTAGELIATLKNDVELSEVSESASKVNIQNAQVTVAEASIAEYEAKLSNATAQYQRLKALYEKGAETKQEVDNSETEYKTLQANISRLKTQVGVARSQVASSGSNTALYKARLEQTKIKAPCNGKILEWKVLPGEGIIAQQAIAQIAPTGNTIVECEIDESLALKVKLNQEAAINYLGTAEVVAKGKVYFLSDYLKKKSLFSEQSGEAEDRRVRVVKILLDNPQGLLLNAKVEVNITGK